MHARRRHHHGGCAVHLAGIGFDLVIAQAELASPTRTDIVVALQEEYGVPVKLVGTGEGLEDLEDFDVDSFVDAIFGP